MVVYLANDFHPMLAELIATYRLGIDYNGGVVLNLSSDRKEALVKAAMAEMAVTGKGPDGQPNTRGLLLEGLVDQVLRHAEA